MTNLPPSLQDSVRADSRGSFDPEELGRLLAQGESDETILQWLNDQGLRPADARALLSARKG